MATYKTKLSVYRGDSKTLTLTFTDNDGEVVDISDSTIILTVKHCREDADDDAIIQKEVTAHTNPTGGISQITIEASETQSLIPNVYSYDIQITLSTGAKKTVAIGDFEILPDVTRG